MLYPVVFHLTTVRNTDIFLKAIFALDNGDVFAAYELFLAAGLYSPAHEIAVFKLAPDAVIRQDLDLLRSLFTKISGHPVDDWQDRGKVGFFLPARDIAKLMPKSFSWIT